MVWIDYDDGHAGGYPHECEVWVCTKHKRFLPCRTCNAAGGNLDSWHSCDPKDVEIVRQYQRSTA